MEAVNKQIETELKTRACLFDEKVVMSQVGGWPCAIIFGAL